MSIASETAEREAETHRHHLAELIDEMRDHATPGQIIDDVLGSRAGRDTLRNLGTQVREHPLPLALVGIGISWLLASDALGRRSATRYAARTGDGVGEARSHTAGRARATFHDTLDAANGIAGGARASMEDGMDAASDMAGRMSEAAGSGYAAARETMQSTAESIAEGARSAMESGAQMAQHSKEALSAATNEFGSLAQEQPLLMAAVGFAVGAFAGTVLPMTDFEHQAFGEAGKETRDSLGAVAAQQYDQAKKRAEDFTETVKENVSRGVEAAVNDALGMATQKPGGATKGNGAAKPDGAADGSAKTDGAALYTGSAARDAGGAAGDEMDMQGVTELRDKTGDA
ncbi:MAG TPA: hypothetical protein VMU22_13435 [Rhizomicrobium sp.]|nr:hypothetical protein [Rhizomicrobium sp.]